MSASIGDVAHLAGVSVATVSRAMRGLPNVSPSTRDRVLRAAERLQYTAHPHASRLAAGRTMTVGMAVPVLTQWFFVQVVAGAEGVLAANGYDVLLYSVPDSDAKQRFVDRTPFSKRVDGLIAVDLPFLPSEIEHLTSRPVPMVTVGTSYRQAPSVTIDNLEAAATATRHLLNLGHRRIGLISHLRPQALAFAAPLLRRQGYERVLEDAGIRVREDLIAPGNYALQGGAEAMAKLLTVDRPPTAVFAESDEMAIGALKTVRDAGLHVPGDISIIGFDDHEMAAFTDLTTVAQPAQQQGETAATLLLQRMVDDVHGTDMTSVVLPTRIVVRATTGPDRSSRHDLAMAR
ncbi:MAG TPA: LacI family DNA-binding transcriptional regulator [Euzebyales bacterium]|nr:LacI family DNA-binding transcriptional regulator [Euzebyales bacterium]